MGTGWMTERQRDGAIDRIPLPPGVAGELRLCGKHAIGAGRFDQPDMPWTTVVCLCQRHELATRYPAYVDWLDTNPDHSIWWPIHDLGAEPVDAATRTVAEARPMAGPEAGSQRALVRAVARATSPAE